MTQGEYRVKLSSLAHKRDKLLRNKENKGYNLDLGRIGKQIIELAKEHKAIHSFTPNTYYTELYLLTQYIPRQELQQVFNYFDSRDKTFAIIPKSLYNSRYILNKLVNKKELNPKPLLTKRLPQELKKYGTRGYSFLLENLADILAQETSRAYDNRMKREDPERIRREEFKARSDYRPFHSRL